MRTKEIAFKHLPNKFKWEVNRKEAECDDFTLIPDWIQNAMKEYARKKCEEQREICSEYAWDKWDTEKDPYIQDSVKNAPEPEFK